MGTSGAFPLDPTGGLPSSTPTLFCGVQKILKLYYVQQGFLAARVLCVTSAVQIPLTVFYARWLTTANPLVNFCDLLLR